MDKQDKCEFHRCPNDNQSGLANITARSVAGSWTMIDRIHQRLRTPAAADYLGYSEATLEKKRLTGGGPPFIRLGRTIVYDTRDLDSWLAARRAISTSDRQNAREHSIGAGG